MATQWEPSAPTAAPPHFSAHVYSGQTVAHLSNCWALVLYWQRYCTALEQWASAKFCGVVEGMELRNFRRRRLHLYSTGRPSRLASAHILVLLVVRWRDDVREICWLCFIVSRAPRLLTYQRVMARWRFYETAKTTENRITRREINLLFKFNSRLEAHGIQW